MEQFLHALSGSRTLLVHFISTTEKHALQTLLTAPAVGRVCWPAAARKKVFVSITGASSKQSRKAVLSDDGSTAIQGMLSMYVPCANASRCDVAHHSFALTLSQQRSRTGVTQEVREREHSRDQLMNQDDELTMASLRKKKDVKHSVLVEVRLDDAHPEQWMCVV